MLRGKKIKVLIVDDSLVFREMLARGLSTDPRIEVVAKASDAFEARDKILETDPDVVTCDIEMPKLNGIDFIRRLLAQYPIPVIVVSGVSDAVFDAMNAGAVEFVSKPDGRTMKDVGALVNELITKIVAASKVQVSPPRPSVAPPAPAAPAVSAQPHAFDTSRIIAIGASTGGTEALLRVLKDLPSNMPGIAIVQHIPPVFSRMFAERLDKQTSLHVKEAENGDYLDVGCVLIAPGDKHMQLRRVGDRYRAEVFAGDRVNGHCPSVDVLFQSVAQRNADRAVGVILTGMGHDGAKGLFDMRKNGSYTIGQDEKSCVVYGMPKSAFEMGGVEKQLPLDAIPGELVRYLSRK
jgi:two-component system chemotaxis response regulator CheB